MRAKAKAPHAINTISHYNCKFTGEVEKDAVSVMTLVVPLIRNKSHFRLQRDELVKGRPISMSATMREQAIIFCTMFSLQICFLLSVKSMRRNPPPGARITFQGSTSPCMTPILWRSCANLYTWALQEILYQRFFKITSITHSSESLSSSHVFRVLSHKSRTRTSTTSPSKAP